MNIARNIYDNKDKIKVVLMAGPSSSGKTTTCNKLCMYLRSFGMNPKTISMDNYFVAREDTPKDKNGNYDFECLGALDLKLFDKQIADIINGNEVATPIYDFVSGKPRYNAGDVIKLDKKDVLIIEKEENLGGNLNLFIHDGFGNFYLGEKVTGPEFSSIMIDDYKKLGGKYLTSSKVLEINADKRITVINPDKGVYDIEAGAIILATGCKEKFTGNIMIPVDRYTGIFTIASAHRLVNFHGYLPGKEVVIQESGKWSALLARRLLIEGAEIKALVTAKESLDKEQLDILNGFDIPVIYNAKISEIGGAERVEWAAVMIDEKDEELIECDSLILSVGYYPEIDLIRSLNVDIKTINTVEDGFFACGTVKHGVEGVFSSGEDGYIIGHLASQYIKKYLY